MEDEGASFPLGNHFEKPFLAGQQQLGPLALGDVRRAAYELHQILGRIQDWMAGRVDVFDRPVRKKDSELHLVIRFLTDCPLDCLLPPGTILRMNALEPLFPRWHALFWIKAIYAIPLRGKMQGFPSRHSPNPTARMREP